MEISQDIHLLTESVVFMLLVLTASIIIVHTLYKSITIMYINAYL